MGRDHRPGTAQKFLPPTTVKGVGYTFQHGLEDQTRVWALIRARPKMGEVCTGLPQGALAIYVPFCYISSVCAVLA